MAKRNGWIEVNEVPTHVYTWGGWIEEEINSDEIIIFITGNPGVPNFYDTFLTHVHKITGKPIWMINHAGHEESYQDLKRPALYKNNHLYDLQGQVEHKYKLIKQYVPPDKKIFLIGHSIGGKIILELLKHEKIAQQVIQNYLIFPTLQNFGETENAILFKHIFSYMALIAIFLSWIFCFLPKSIQYFLIKGYYFYTNFRYGMKYDDGVLIATRKLINPRVLRAVFFLVNDEIKNIKELDYEVLDKYHQKMVLYYAKQDGWAPLSHEHILKKLYPTIKTVLMKKPFYHTFVYYSAKEMANIIGDEIKTTTEVKN